MNVQGFQKLTLLDFPGKVACTVFTGGCNLRCPFCHNASLVETPRENENSRALLFSYLEKRKGILDGVCITGGEPLLQEDLAEEIFRIKEMGFSVKLDTNGSFPDKLQKILASGAVDYVAMDLKTAPEKYPLATGVKLDFSRFAESMHLLRESGISYEFRTTVVKGIHEKGDLLRIADLLLSSEKYFLQGFVDSGNILKAGMAAFSEEEMKDFLLAVRKKVPLAELRGQSEL